jgi:hypothetical protein
MMKMIGITSEMVWYLISYFHSTFLGHSLRHKFIYPHSRFVYLAAVRATIRETPTSNSRYVQIQHTF